GVTNDESYQPLLPGGFASFLVTPGTSHFKLQRLWDVELLSEDHPASASMNVSEASQEVQAARVYFLRVRPRAGLLGRRPELAAIPSVVGEREVQVCRRVVWTWGDASGR